MINYYEKIKNVNKIYNPNYNKHKIKIPFRALIIGSSGSGKTNTILNLLKEMNGTFSSIDIYTRQPDEPLYKHLLEVYKKNHTIGEEEALNIHEGIMDLKPLNEYDETKNHLVIFDDMILEKNLKQVAEYYIRCRKKGVSVIFLSQSYYLNDQNWKIIRRQANYIIIKKINSVKELMAIIKDYSLDVSKEEFLKMYEDITKENKFNFLMVDLDEEPEKRFRKNYDVINI
jgi:ABC-type dipeptide/oligopeptide/nickel transport system ATPase component